MNPRDSWESQKNEYKMFVRKLERKNHLGAKHRLEVNIKMDLRETGYESVEYVYISEDMCQWWTLVNDIVKFWVAWSVSRLSERPSASKELLFQALLISYM